MGWWPKLTKHLAEGGESGGPGSLAWSGWDQLSGDHSSPSEEPGLPGGRGQCSVVAVGQAGASHCDLTACVEQRLRGRESARPSLSSWRGVAPTWLPSGAEEKRGKEERKGACPCLFGEKEEGAARRGGGAASRSLGASCECAGRGDEQRCEAVWAGWRLAGRVMAADRCRPAGILCEAGVWRFGVAGKPWLS